MKNSVIFIQMLKSFIPFQIGISLTGAYSLVSSKLADECYCITQPILIFS